MLKYLTMILLSMSLMSGPSAFAQEKPTVFVESQCIMLGDIGGTIAASVIRGETNKKILNDLFPDLNKFPQDIKVFIIDLTLAIRAMIELDPVAFAIPEFHAVGVAGMCMDEQGSVAAMQKRLDKFLK